jgi:hypothetical protein
MRLLVLIALTLGTAFSIVPLASAVPLSDGDASVAAGPTGVQLTGKDRAAYYDTGAVVTSQPIVPLGGKDRAAFYDTGAMVTSEPAPTNGLTFHTDVLGGDGGVTAAPSSVQLTGKDRAAFYDTGAVVTSQPIVPLTGKDRTAFYDTGAMVTSGSAPTNGLTFDTDTLGGNGGSSSTPSSSGNSFDWNTTLGATLAGMLLLVLGAATITRRKHRLSY